jgi:hypothetical protein
MVKMQSFANINILDKINLCEEKPPYLFFFSGKLANALKCLIFFSDSDEID